MEPFIEVGVNPCRHYFARQTVLAHYNWLLIVHPHLLLHSHLLLCSFFFLICNPNLQKPQIPYLLPTSIYYRKFPLQIMCAAHGKQFSFKIVPLLPICKGLPIFCRSGGIFPKIKIRGQVPNT